MPRPRTDDALKKARGTYRKPLIEGCPHALKRKRRARKAAAAGVITPEVLEAYEEFVDLYEEKVPHIDDSHGVPSPEDLEDIEAVEGVVNAHLPPELHLKSARLFRMIQHAS